MNVEKCFLSIVLEFVEVYETSESFTIPKYKGNESEGG